jgi:hypothetical protein
MPAVVRELMSSSCIRATNLWFAAPGHRAAGPICEHPRLIDFRTIGCNRGNRPILA